MNTKYIPVIRNVLASIALGGAVSLSVARPPRIIDVAYLKGKSVGSTVRFKAIILPGGAGYWYVLRSPKCDNSGVIRIASNVDNRIVRAIFRAEQRSVKGKGFYIQANFKGFVVQDVTRERESRSIKIKSFSELSLRQIDCLKHYL